jgi:hypothetical protein
MKAMRDNEYQDSNTVGALVGALALWRTLQVSNRQSQPQQVTFELVCSSESRALRTAAFLRRNPACTTTSVTYVQAKPRADWRVQGATRREVQSLANLERLFTWLRQAADSHQVRLTDLHLT